MSQNIEHKIQEDLSPTKKLKGIHLKVVAAIAIIWSLFQLWYASPFPFWFNIGMFKGLPARAIHLGFALLLAFLIFPYSRSKKISIIDIAISIVGVFCCFYIYLFYDQLVDRGGILLKITLSKDIIIPIELIIGICGILILLEATRRVIGVPLVIIAISFLLFSYFGQYAPDIISHGGLSLKRLVGFQWFDQEAIFGIPIGVSVDFIFLFVLFGALLETAGGGKYFLDLAFAMVGKMRGGPAKAAILGSGMTGLISGSSIANTVTTGTFTIPIMKRTGFSKEKAGAIEVSSSVNGQIMPPVMGAAAFVMASFIGVTYFEVVRHAFLPAIISYIALFYISHLEALKLNLKGMEDEQVPNLKKTFLAGLHYWYPKFVGKMYSEKHAKIGCFFTFLGFNVTFLPQFIMGARGLPRRYYDYPPEFTELNQISTIGAYMIAFGLVWTMIALIIAVFKGEKASSNPWEANTLEWRTSSPPYHENFETEPVVTTGPYDYHSEK